MTRLIDADEMLKRLESWNTDDVMDKALYNFTLSRIIEQQTVDAVPVNWLTNLAKEYEESDNQFFRMDSCVIEDLIKSWKEEQGKNND